MIETTPKTTDNILRILRENFKATPIKTMNHGLIFFLIWIIEISVNKRTAYEFSVDNFFC